MAVVHNTVVGIGCRTCIEEGATCKGGNSLGLNSRFCVVMNACAFAVISWSELGRWWPMQVHFVFGGGYFALGFEYWKSRPVRESVSGSQRVV